MEGVSQDSEDEGVEQGDEELLLPSAPVKLSCKEDDDFLADLDRMVNENISESKNLLRDKNTLATVSAPISTQKGKKNWEQLQEEGEEDESKVQVMIMLRKGGGKTGGVTKITKGISVSADSQLGEQFIAREEREAR